MKYTIILGPLLIFCMLCIALQFNGSSAEETTAPSLRSRIALPKIFNFELFEQIYKKSYRSLVENLARRRIYLAKSFRAFISMVFYKNRQSSSYLAINEMSDWTPEEVEKTFMDPEIALRGHGLPHVVKKEKSNEEVPVADLDDIKEELEEIVEHRFDNPGSKAIADELVKIKDRALSDGMSADDLLRARNPITNTADDYVSSNTPNYQVPKMLSVAPDTRKAGLDVEQSVGIASESDSNFFSQMMHKIFTFVGSEEDNDVDMNEDRMYIDHRACFPHEPRNQGGCGSCYAFSSVAMYEWHYCKTTGKSITFSEQSIIDCGRRFGLNGCGGGAPEFIHLLVNQYGLELNRNYPYREIEGTCPYPERNLDDSIGHLRVQSEFRFLEPQDLEKDLQKSPLLVAMNCNIAFTEYGGGVDEPKTCRTTYHGMVLVGSGREDGQDYWLIRNSHGINWGERGYYKLAKKSTCSNVGFYYRLDNFKVIKAKSEV